MFGFLDCSSGVSGDKFLGALVDAGLSPDVLRQRLEGLKLPGWDLSSAEVVRGGLRATLVTVAADAVQPSRTWSSIEALLLEADLTGRAREGALRAFRALARAEALAHGAPLADVHFHEVGAVDSIIDIVGTAIGLDELDVGEVWGSPVCVGSGTVTTAHGVLPVPAPATAELLLGVPTYAGSEEGEMTTPTGAALLRAFVSEYAPAPLGVGVAIGYGAGSRETAVPNTLRLTLSESAAPRGTDEQVVMLESVIDHMAPEHLATALELVLEAGALDVWQTPVVMKKGRLAASVTVMTRPQDAPRLSHELMRQTGTLGVRHTPTWRAVAGRRVEVADTDLGEVRIKTGGLPGEERSRPESDEVAAIARRTGHAVSAVAAKLAREASTPKAPGPQPTTE